VSDRRERHAGGDCDQHDQRLGAAVRYIGGAQHGDGDGSVKAQVHERDRQQAPIERGAA